MCIVSGYTIVVLQPEPAQTRLVALGQLDVVSWDVSAHGPIALDRNWRVTHDGAVDEQGVEFKRGDRVEFFGARADQSATKLVAGLNVALPQNQSFADLALSTGSFTAHFKLYIQDRLAYDSRAESGNWQGAPGYTSLGSVVIPPDAIGHNLRLTYVFEADGLETLEMDTAPRLGGVASIVSSRDLISVAMLILIGAMLFASAYHVVVYAATRDNAATLVFATFTALFGLRTIVIEPVAGYVVPYVGPDVLWRLNFTLTVLLGPACYWFFAYAFPRHISWTLGKGLTAFSAVAALVCILGDYQSGLLCLKLFQLSALVLIVAVFRGILLAAWIREPGATLALIGWFCSAVPAIHDILVDAKIINGPNLMPFGFLAFFLCLSGILSARLHRAHTLHRSTAMELKALNENLESRIADRTEELSQQLVALEQQSRELEQARAAAVAASQAKSRFLANMSHELRTPLNAIIGFSEMIEKRILGDGAVAKYSEYAGYINRSGSLLLRLINGVLDLSKIEAGKFELNKSEAQLSHEIETSIELVAMLAGRKSIRVAALFEFDPRVTLDRLAFQQVLLNLLSNAIKFTPANGEILVKTARHQNGGLSVDVCDTGVGIAQEDLDRVMENFGQAKHDVTTHDERGTGLGLPIARGLVEAHGGRLTMSSKLGEGTTASIELPPACLSGEFVRHVA